MQSRLGSVEHQISSNLTSTQASTQQASGHDPRQADFHDKNSAHGIIRSVHRACNPWARMGEQGFLIR